MAPTMIRCAGRRKGSINHSPSRCASSEPEGVPSETVASPVTRLVRSVAGRFSSRSLISCSWTAANGWTKTSIWPPHASPTENATSSATPKAASLGLPAFITFCASSNTALSMQPFETEPAILPDRVTTIFEPSGRGLDPQVSTTVARAISSLFSVHVFSSVRTSRTSLSPPPRRPRIEVGQHPSEVFERLHVVYGQEVIAIGKRGHHAPGERLIAIRSEQRVQPDQPVRRTPEVDELGRELSGIAAVPTVADDDHDRAVPENAPRPTAIEVRERLADASASAEIVHALAH